MNTQTATQAAPIKRLKLGAILLARGKVSEDELDRVLRLQAASTRPEKLGSLLTTLGVVSARDIAQALAVQADLPYVETSAFPEMPILEERISARFLRDSRALPIEEDEDTLTLAVADPFNDFVRHSFEIVTNRQIHRVVAVGTDIDTAIERLYGGGRTVVGSLSDGDLEARIDADALGDDIQQLKDLASEAPVIRLVSLIITNALETRASDIHIEPFEGHLRVRYRNDGTLQEAESPPARLSAAIVSRIKIMARLDIAQRYMPQDGRIQMAVRGQDIDFRVATIPALHGETVVLRVLDRSVVAFDWDALGLSPAVVSQFTTALGLPNGIVLVSGPTGSGKTTTLYTGLLSLNSVERKVVTIEDPIEYQLDGIVQSQVKPQIDLTFASLLRSNLRHNPDVIMVGEIRDQDTAQIAVQAALTGHLVLSTVHTNSAAATITRLRDMGLEDYLLTAVLRGVLAQRLVRRLCTHCKRQAEAPAAVVERFGLDQRTAQRPVLLCHPVGCSQCRNTGYRGRLAVAEFLSPTATIERLIFERADHTQIERAAVEAGMVPMIDAGLDAALAGLTTLEDVVRSIRAEA